jgi:ABC-type nitrate/sulfonate/bicarbonate transport system permease component
LNGRLLRGVAGLVGIFLVWEIASWAGLVDKALLPAPTGVVARVFTMFGESDFQVAMIATLLTWVLSLVITVAIALPLGILLGSLPAVRTATSAVIEFLRPIPAVALIPVVSVLLGGGPVSTITLAVFAGTWPMLFTVVAAIRETDPMLLETARVFGVRRLAAAVRVRLPAVARALVIGIRVSVGLELIVIVSTGLLTGINGGIGQYLWNAGEAAGDTTTVLAGTIVIGVVGYLANQGLLGLQQVRWLHPTASSAPETESARPSHWLIRFVQRWGVLVGLVVVWQLVTMRLANLYAPTPTAIASSAWQNVSTLLPSLPISLGKLGLGWLIAVVGGVGLGLVLGMLPRAADVIEPVGAFIRAIPPVLLLPVLVIWTKLGTPFEVTTIALGCAWPLLVQTIEGVRSIEPVLIDTSHTYRTGRLRHTFTVIAPAAAPKILTGLRISLSLALILMVITELLGGTEGLGFQLGFADQQFDYPLMWACIVLLSIVGYLLNQLLLTADRRLVSWRRQSIETQ